jgi:hypothetical protein
MISDRAIRGALERFRLTTSLGSAASGCRLQVLLDASLSMGSGDGAKEQLARELTILLLQLSQRAGLRGTLRALRGAGRDREIPDSESGRVAHIPFDGSQALAESLKEATLSAGRGTLRVVISDFLSPADPQPLVRQTAEGADGLWAIQIMDEAELNPVPGGLTVLHDVETEEMLEVVMDHAAITAYRSRLDQLCADLSQACSAVGASLTTVSAAVGLEKLCADWLVPTKLLCAIEARESQVARPVVS